MAALDSLGGAFSSKLLYDFLIERRLTVSDCLERSLRKGGGEEQAAAATVCAQLCVQLGGGDEGEEGFKILRPVLSAIMIDGCASVSARQSVSVTIGLRHTPVDLVKSMSHLESVFTMSYPNREGTLPTPNAGAPGLHSAALHFWALLVTLCPLTSWSPLVLRHLPKLQACLESSDVNYRIAVGETIALLVELGRDIDREFEFEDSDTLCECLKGLATDGNKHRAKNDRRKQRTIFREVLHYIENEDFSEEKIRFGVEGIYIDSWMLRHHLQYNPLLRDIFGLGPPLILDSSVKSSKISRFEKHLFNSAAFKARTKLRNKVRDKRADVM
uniref:Interferon-related developmental regulator 2 n=1 Tax=Salmo trutta TaxID=8032 RepID=A0A674CLM0_SALTR